MNWKAYKCGTVSSNPNWTNPDCIPTMSVFHTAHVNDALRIVEDGYIRSSLVWDESRLNNTRTCVSWVSPNTWNESIYGNVRFEFDWPSLAAGKRFYGVEIVTHYNPTAYRILVTDKEHSESGIKEFQIDKDEGPLYYSKADKVWYSNGVYNGELMIEADLPLELCKQIDFVTHHNHICNKFLPRKNRGMCPELGLPFSKAAPRFLSNILGSENRTIDSLLKDIKKSHSLNFGTLNGVVDLFSDLINGWTPSTMPARDKEHKVLLQAALLTYASGKAVEAKEVLNLLGSPNKVLKSGEGLIDSHFGVAISTDSEWKALYGQSTSPVRRS